MTILHVYFFISFYAAYKPASTMKRDYYRGSTDSLADRSMSSGMLYKGVFFLCCCSFFLQDVIYKFSYRSRNNGVCQFLY